jgi:DNA-binding NarL/FixJ family response regulator
MIRVCLVEDHPQTREGFVNLLRLSEKLVCIGAFASAEEAEREIPKLQPDVVLMDINLGEGRSGVECVAKLKIEHPQIQIMMLTTYDDNEMIFNSLRAGASGYLLKRATAKELVEAIVHLKGGGSPMSHQIARKVVSHFHQYSAPQGNLEELTKREKEVLSLLASGLPYKLIADKLGISVNTVRNILQHIYKKLHVQSRAEATLKFLQK